MQINVTFDQSVASLPTGFVTAVNYVVNYLDSTFTNPVTVNIHVGYGEVAGQSLGTGALGASLTYIDSLSYSQALAALKANQPSPTQQTAYSTLPATSPLPGGTLWMATAEEKALGLLAANDPSIDGYVGFSSVYPFSYGINSQPASGQYYFIGVVEHEITEVLGRDSWLGDRLGGTTSYSVMDLFRYSAPGVRDLTATPPSPYNVAYFSINNGSTNLDNWNTNPNGDLGDWAASAGADAFLAFSPSGQINQLGAADVAVMNVIGWNVVVSRVVIQTNGSTSLTLVGGQNYYLFNSSGSGPSVKYGGADVVVGEFGPWHPIGAVQTASGYDIAWKLGTDQYSVWATDSNGNYVSNLITVAPGASVALEGLEPTFGQDLNGDGVIGLYAAPGTTLQITIPLAGASGATTIGAGATLVLSAADSASTTFASSTGRLVLTNPSTFTGTIFGFTGSGTLAGSDQIDLKGIDSNSAQANYAGGQLTVIDGTNTALLNFNGSYAPANFKLASDGSGGTIVYDPPINSPAAQAQSETKRVPGALTQQPTPPLAQSHPARTIMASSATLATGNSAPQPAAATVASLASAAPATEPVATSPRDVAGRAASAITTVERRANAKPAAAPINGVAIAQVNPAQVMSLINTSTIKLPVHRAAETAAPANETLVFDESTGALGRGPVAILDQVLWRDLLAAESAEAFGAAWLNLACRVIAGASGGVLILKPDGAPPRLVAMWPAKGVPDPVLVATAQHAMQEGRGVVQPPPAGSGQKLRAAYPIQLDNRAVGAVALDVEHGPGRDARETMRQLQWSVAWVRDFLRRQTASDEHHAADRTALALDLVAAALEEETARSACRVAATELAIQLGCERVSFGFLVRGESRIAGISHSAQFGKRMNLVRQLADAMDEAIDQKAVVLFPPPDTDDHILVRAHAALGAGHGSAFILTVPMFVKDRFVGAVTFERASGRSFDQPTIDIAETVASILGPALFDKRANDRSIFVKCVDAIATQAQRLLGPGYLGRKLAALAMLALVLFFYLATGEYRISATGQVEGEVRRAIVAPFDGFLGEAPARAGDLVHQGNLLAALDNRDLVLERLRWVTERQQHLYEYDQALSKQERADALKYQNLLAQAEAQIRLVDEQLTRSRMLAPFDALVVSGDLTQSIGAAVRRGDVLFELAPLANYRIELRVDESQIADVALGQQGELVVAALPEETFPFTIERITPVASTREGATYFSVEGRLTASSERLRPGMEGIGKIDIDERRLIWIWLRPLLHWVRVATWKWLP